MSNQLTRENIVALLPINNMLYTRTAPSNPVVERTQKRSFAEGGSGTTYTQSDHLIANLQSGNDFIDTLQSFLVFDVKSEGAAAYLVGSIMNLIRDSQVSTRSGKEMDRAEMLNVRNYHMIKDMPDQYLKNNLRGLMMAEDSNLKAVIDAIPGARSILGTTYTRVMIPLKYISPIFDSSKLMPPHLSRGLRIDCTLENFATALTSFTSPSTITGYTIKKPFILTDNYRMADSVLEFVNSEYASKDNGLVYEYFSWHTSETTNTGSSLNVEVRRSVSMATDAFCVTIPVANKNNVLTDSFASAPVSDDDKSQWRIGSHYLPNSQIEGITEHYAQYLYWGGKLREQDTTGTSYHEFTGLDTVVADTSVNFGMGKFCTTLQRNAILDLSGIAINNSSTLAINATLGVGDTRNVYIFLRHLRRAIMFMESVVLET